MEHRISNNMERIVQGFGFEVLLLWLKISAT